MQYVSSNNKVSQLPYLLRLNLESNSVKDLKALNNEENFKNLRVLNLSKNKIADMGAIKVSSLQQLNLNDNKIEKFDGFDGHAKLRVLEMRRNKVVALTIFANMPELKELYLAENKIKTMVGLEILLGVQTLNLRKNNVWGFLKD